MGKKTKITINWEPQERQLLCLKACGLSQPFDENLLLRPSGSKGEPFKPAIADIIGYGGSAGGGKTDTLLQVGAIGGLVYPKLNIGYFRREFPQLEGPGGAIQRSLELFSHFGKWSEQKHRWKFPTFIGNRLMPSILQFCHCKNPDDVYNYQSQQFDILLIDEVTQFTRDMVKYLLTRNRATVKYPYFRPFACFGTNPGNAGHQYFKDEFVTIGEPEKVHIYINETGKEEKHIFIPSKLWDNQILVDRDPGYENRVGNTEFNRKLLLEGDWDAFAGQAFAELNRNVHLINPFPIPKHWKKFGAYDHGYNHPFSYGVFAVDEDGNVYLVRYVSSRLKRPDEIARMIASVYPINELSYIVAGHDCWSRGRDGGPTIAEQFFKTPEKISIQEANIDRVQGTAQVRMFIAWKNAKIDKDNKPIDGEPRFFIFRNCQPVYETLSRMVFDPGTPEDVLKVDADETGKGGDDDYDMVRYGLMSRPRPAIQKEIKAPVGSIQSYIQKKKEQKYLREEYVGYN